MKSQFHSLSEQHSSACTRAYKYNCARINDRMISIIRETRP